MSVQCCSNFRFKSNKKQSINQQVTCLWQSIVKNVPVKKFSKSDKKQIGPLSVSPLGLGTWAWGNKFLWNYDPSMDEELQQVFNYAVDRGINLFDTADSYGTGRLNGRSEQLLGQFIEEYQGDTSDIHIATKLAAYPWRVLPQNMVWACEGSLRRLNAQSLSLGQLHWSAANYAPLQEIALWNGLSDCYERGLIRAVGVSNYGPKEVKQISKKFNSRGVPLSSAQIQFSLLSNGRIQQRLLEECGEQGITIIAYSPLALGMLTGKYDIENLPQGPRGVLFKQILPKISPLIDLLEIIAKERRKTMSQVAINWCICKGTVPIPGVKTMKQVQDNLGALGWSLRDGEIQELDRISQSLKTSMVQNIFQTS